MWRPIGESRRCSWIKRYLKFSDVSNAWPLWISKLHKNISRDVAILSKAKPFPGVQNRYFLNMFPTFCLFTSPFSLSMSIKFLLNSSNSFLASSSFAFALFLSYSLCRLASFMELYKSFCKDSSFIIKLFFSFSLSSKFTFFLFS